MTPAFQIVPLLFLAALCLAVPQPGVTGSTREPAAQAAAPAAPPDEAARAEARRKARDAGRLLERGELGEALKLARQAVAADPTNAQTRYVLALVHEASGDLDEAEAEYRRMGVFAPEPLLELSLARLYLRQGRLADAEQQARIAVEKNRWVPQPHLSLGAVAMRKGEHALAIESFRNAVQADPGDAASRLSLGDAYRAAGRWDEALAEYAEALASRPSHPQALLGRAQTWEAMGRPGEAIVAYERALEANPDLLAAKWNLARLYLVVTEPRLQKPRRALELAKAAAEATRWESPEVLETLARAYAVQGDLARANEVRERIRALQ
jgi:tetratricopeptide (TPR) repeat protein